MIIKKHRIPIGVIAIIFESRPYVVVDCAALAIKSGNAAILKGGKRALHSNQILGQVVAEAVTSLLPDHSIQVHLAAAVAIDLVWKRGNVLTSQHSPFSKLN